MRGYKQRIIVRGIRRKEPDVRLVAQALIRLAQEEAKAAAKSPAADGEVLL